MFCYHPDAAEEAAEAAARYESERHGLGARFLRELQQLEAEVAEFPELGAVLQLAEQSRLRSRMLRRFPFSIIYVVDQEILIIAVAHAKRRPGYWRKRRG